MPEKKTKTQRFPVFYTGAGEFKLDETPSGRRGAIARVNIGLNNRPHELVGIRLRNSYARFPTPTILIGQPPDPETGSVLDPVAGIWGAGMLPPAANSLCCLLEALDDEQLIEVELAQQNIVIKDIHQRLLCGENGKHWHPFPCSYPFRGGNNIAVRARRLQDYPHSSPEDPELTIIKPTLYVAVFGWMFVSDEMPPSGPPSTDFPESP